MIVVDHPSEQNIYENSGVDQLARFRWIDMQNYRDPPPYPGHSKQVYTNQPGFRQSFSGSETSTDVSISSNENLATTQRQEPQGEETQTTFNYNLDLGNTDGNNYSILERLGMPASVLDSSGKFSGVNVVNMPVPELPQDKSQQPNQASAVSTSNSVGLSPASSPLYSQGHLTVPQWHLGNKVLQIHGSFTQQKNESSTRQGEYIPISSRSDTETMTSMSSSTTTHCVTNRDGTGNSSSYNLSSDRTGSVAGMGSRLLASLLPSSATYPYLSPRVSPASTYHHPHPYVNTHWIVGNDDFKLSSYSSSYGGFNSSSSPTLNYSQTGGKGNTDADANTYPSHGQSMSYLTTLPPPPEYPGGSRMSEKGTDIRTCRSYEAMDKMDTPRSHPDLRLCASSPGICMHDVRFQSPHRSSNNSADDTDQISIAAKACQMVEILTEDNRALREEVAASSVKVVRLQNFEMEIQKVHESYEALVKSSQKQEALWLAMRRKLEDRIKELEARGNDGADTERRIRLAEKDAMISKLLSQNLDLSSSRDQLEVENSQLTLSLAEQRARVDILERALLNAQSKILALEDEFRKKQAYVNKVEQLQKGLTSLQVATEKQQQKEKEMRTHLEKELELYRTREKGGNVKKPEIDINSVKSVGTLRTILEEKEERILQLESQMAELEQNYVKETTLRQMTMEDASQISQHTLEKNSSEMGKFIDEVKTEKLKHMEELHQSHRKVAELESKVKQLQRQLIEKEAMVKVFQRSPLAMARSSSLHVLCHPSPHSARPSLISPHGWAGSSQTSESATYREFATVRHVKAGSASAVELGRKMSMEDELLSKMKYLHTQSKSDSEDEGKLSYLREIKKNSFMSQ